MTSDRDMLKNIWVDMQLDKEGGEPLSERMAAWEHELEKKFGMVALNLQLERFHKTDNWHMQVGRKVVCNQDVPYEVFFNDPGSYHRETGDPDKLPKGLQGVIEDIDIGIVYYDCNVVFSDGNMWACRVEWLEWLESEEMENE